MNMRNYRPDWFFHSLFKAIPVLILCGLIYRCGSALYVPTVEDQQRTGIMLDSLSDGRKLYVDRCGSCHNLYLPAQYTESEWEKNVEEMQVKAKVTDSQKTKMLCYLKSGCKTAHQ
jgi:hypothetical protein